MKAFLAKSNKAKNLYSTSCTFIAVIKDFQVRNYLYFTKNFIRSNQKVENIGLYGKVVTGW